MTSARPEPSELAERGARTIHDSFLAFQTAFARVTRRARARFERLDWRGMQDDVQYRLAVYRESVDRMEQRLRFLLGPHAADQRLWREIKQTYVPLNEGERNAELGRTFFNSATRRIFSTVGVNPQIEFLSTRSAVGDEEADPRTFSIHPGTGQTRQLIRDILEDHRFGVVYRDLEGDAARGAQAVDAYLASLPDPLVIDRVETLKPVFFRNKGAYIISRVCAGDRFLPMVLPLVNTCRGVTVDAVLMNENDVSIVFSFARSYFHVEWDCPHELIVFLKSIMPRKPIAELYTSLGFNKHGKTELYRSLQKHLSLTDDKFRIAEGDRGMVMLVFTLPMFDVVFKVIRDRFDYPKSTTRRDVMDRYRLVFEHDRVGRLVDAQEFEHLKFDRHRFDQALLADLLKEADSTVKIQGDEVAFRHLYTERRVTPLNLFLRDADPETARRTVLDYGRAIEDLAAADIFPGDFLLKNFGVTRHGRVVFYDYDELCRLRDCRFRVMPQALNPEQELQAEPWFTPAENDIFPEEFERFLGLPPDLRKTFVGQHGRLFTAAFWRELQDRHRAGEIMDFFPYPDHRRLK